MSTAFVSTTTEPHSAGLARIRRPVTSSAVQRVLGSRASGAPFQFTGDFATNATAIAYGVICPTVFGIHLRHRFNKESCNRSPARRNHLAVVQRDDWLRESGAPHA